MNENIRYFRELSNDLLLIECMGQSYYYNCRDCGKIIKDEKNRFDGYCPDCKPEIVQKAIEKKKSITKVKLDSLSNIKAIPKNEIKRKSEPKTNTAKIPPSYWIPRKLRKSESEIAMQERINHIVEEANKKKEK